MKMIMPIARPAKVSVSQVEKEPTSGRAMAASASTSNTGRRSARTCGSGASASRVLIGGFQGKAEQARLQRLVLGQLRHAAGVHHAAVVHDGHAVADLAREIEVLFDQQDGGGCLLELDEGVDHVLHDGRRQALAGFVDQQQPARFDDGTRDRQHLLLPAGKLAGRMQPELAQRGKNPKIHSSRAVSSWLALARARQQDVLLHRQVGEDAHVPGT